MRRIPAALVLLAGCTGGAGDTGKATSAVVVGEALPGFALPDTNPTSPSFGTDVAVGDFEGRVSAWYFAHAT